MRGVSNKHCLLTFFISSGSSLLAKVPTLGFLVFNALTEVYFGECSIVSNTFLVLFSNKILLFKAGICKLLVRMTNREDPDQTASSEAV